MNRHSRSTGNGLEELGRVLAGDRAAELGSAFLPFLFFVFHSYKFKIHNCFKIIMNQQSSTNLEETYE